MPETIDRKVRYLLLNGFGIDNDKIGVLEIIISTINNYFRMTPPPPGCWLRGQDVRSRQSLVTSPVTDWNISTTHNPRTVPGGDGGGGGGGCSYTDCRI